jgi:hypothetical protein
VQKSTRQAERNKHLYLNTMIAINKKNQRQVNKAVKFLIAYNTNNDLRTLADDNFDLKNFILLNRKCEKNFDNYLKVCAELPKREVKQIEKSNLY